MRHGEVEDLNQLTEAVLNAAIKVHRELGPGLLESAYEACLCFELTRRGFLVERQKPQPIVFDGLHIDCGYRIDLLVEGKIVLEVKAITQVLKIHQQQVLTYLRLSDRRVGLVINFNQQRLMDGVKRVVNDFPDRACSLAT
jgi:GxxExxY protein